jgi:nicotinate-nucleotide adenylyltransferase
MKVGLYFGSFNPVHVGHLIIADFVANNSDVQQVWLVVSPQNPLKPSHTLLNEYHRLHLVNLAIEGNIKLKASDVEFSLPKPSYTIDTLTYLKEKYPQNEFVVIVGSDSYQNLSQWKNYSTLIKNYSFIVYQRPGFEATETPEINAIFLKASMLDISSTIIRAQLKEKKSVRYLLPEKVFEEIERSGWYSTPKGNG